MNDNIKVDNHDVYHDIKNVSTISIGEAIDYMKQEVMIPFVSKSNAAIDNYDRLTGSGGLRSGNIEIIIKTIKNKITKMDQDFNAMAEELSTIMGQSQEEITAERQSIEDSLNRLA